MILIVLVDVVALLLIVKWVNGASIAFPIRPSAVVSAAIIAGVAVELAHVSIHLGLPVASISFVEVLPSMATPAFVAATTLPGMQRYRNN